MGNLNLWAILYQTKAIHCPQTDRIWIDIVVMRLVRGKRSPIKMRWGICRIGNIVGDLTIKSTVSEIISTDFDEHVPYLLAATHLNRIPGLGKSGKSPIRALTSSISFCSSGEAMIMINLELTQKSTKRNGCTLSNYRIQSSLGYPKVTGGSTK